MSSAAGYILQVKDLVAGYIRDLPILHGVSVYVDRGEIVTIIGPNGAGKSTLIKAVAGLVSVSQGSIELNGKNIVNVPAYQRATQGVGYVPQTGNV
ncbi:MAG: ATP-binding cassette domain-containing protein, partial [Paracoccaceae bacterium]